jgi:chitodextrinase
MTVKAFDTAGNQSALSVPLAVSTTRSAPPTDTTAPSVPTGLAATNVMTTGFTLSWAAATDNFSVNRYEIYRNDVKLADSTAATFAVTGLTPGTGYAFKVVAVDAAGNKSGDSAVLQVTTVATPTTDTTAPSVPTGLASSNITTTGFRVSWNASTDNVGVTGYNVYRNGTYIGTTTGTFFNFTGLTKITSYNITVLAFDAAKNRSAQSAALAVKTLP